MSPEDAQVPTGEADEHRCPPIISTTAYVVGWVFAAVMVVFLVSMLFFNAEHTRAQKLKQRRVVVQMCGHQADPGRCLRIADGYDPVE